MTPFDGEVADATAARALGPEYVAAVGKVIASHVRNELAGATAFDEPAIALAPTPRDKWLACRIAMEEYGHHLKFARLASELGLEDASTGRALSVFDYRLTSWTEFVVLKALVDLAEVVLMDELLATSYLPLRRLVGKLLPEEHFHVAFGKAGTRELAADPQAVSAIQQAVDDLIGFTVPFFGRSVSANNEAFRQWGVKQRTNDEARGEWAARCRQFVEGELGLRFPEVDLTWNG
ncbi:MAG TPA: Phenylacetic acid catabolic protein [Acidimicrobiales bacterium]|jgi:ring-1,2-phenylacetyl-CoA epoxidase subunit PaaA|nr:Phenylacetic acid catabolic protein [Acidimicrobiales bacterium]HWH34749.1 Phenylacetic acid catabolic protein [Acidimicrobiales bacterium]